MVFEQSLSLSLSETVMWKFLSGSWVSRTQTWKQPKDRGRHAGVTLRSALKKFERGREKELIFNKHLWHVRHFICTILI